MFNFLWTFEQRGLQRQKIESALNHTFELILPYAPDLYVEAINTGRPIVIGKPQSKSAEAMRYFASRLHTARNP